VSVRPVTFHPDGSIDVLFDETGHTGTLAPSQVVWGKNADGTDRHDGMTLACPDGCGGTSWHPVGGGADPPNIQYLFVDKTKRDGCACGQVAPGRTDAVPQSHVELNVNRQDGPDHWQLDPMRLGLELPEQQPAGGPPVFQVVYRNTDRLIVGLHPQGGVGPDHGVSVVRDLAEYDVLMRTEPAYLSADGQHILGGPPTGVAA
jgi:hypothetical protein